MGKQSTRENKTIYQLCREAAGLTRAEASEKMDAVSDSKIEKFEYETQEPTPYDILQMADAYKRPDLCNYYCSHKCEIGQRAIVFSKFYHIFPKGESLFAPVSSLFRYHREAFKKTPYYPRSSHADDTEFLLYLNELQMAEPKGRPVFMRDRSQRQGSQRWIRMQTGQPGI